jgi:hypothetical protein
MTSYMRSNLLQAAWRSGNKNKRKADQFMFAHVAQREAMRMFVENTHVLQGFSTTFKPAFVAEVIPVRFSVLRRYHPVAKRWCCMRSLGLWVRSKEVCTSSSVKKARLV